MVFEYKSGNFFFVKLMGNGIVFVVDGENLVVIIWVDDYIVVVVLACRWKKSVQFWFCYIFNLYDVGYLGFFNQFIGFG